MEMFTLLPFNQVPILCYTDRRRNDMIHRWIKKEENWAVETKFRGAHIVYAVI